jgi:hypothetical protein
MTRTIGSFSLILSVALLASTSDTPAKASTWHSDIGVHGYYCPGGGKAVHLEDCGKKKGGGQRQERSGGGAAREACSGDVRRFCGAVASDPAARRTCMKTHHEELSAGCKAARTKH